MIEQVHQPECNDNRKSDNGARLEVDDHRWRQADRRQHVRQFMVARYVPLHRFLERGATFGVTAIEGNQLDQVCDGKDISPHTAVRLEVE